MSGISHWLANTQINESVLRFFLTALRSKVMYLFANGQSFRIKALIIIKTDGGGSSYKLCKFRLMAEFAWSKNFMINAKKKLSWLYVQKTHYQTKLINSLNLQAFTSINIHKGPVTIKRKTVINIYCSALLNLRNKIGRTPVPATIAQCRKGTTRHRTKFCMLLIVL